MTTAKKTTARKTVKKTTARKTAPKKTVDKKLTEEQKRKLMLEALEEQGARQWGEWTDNNEDVTSLTPKNFNITKETLSSYQEWRKVVILSKVAKENAKPVKKRQRIVDQPLFPGLPTIQCKPSNKDWTVIINSEPLVTPELLKKAK